MPTPVLEPVSVADTELFEFLSNEPTVPCAYEDCREEAAWFLVCPCTLGKETVCKTHKLVFDMLEHQMPENFALLFNKTCGHNPLVRDCSWLPFG